MVESGQLREALLYETNEDGSVHCYLCPHHCVIQEGQRGICQVRSNKEGILNTHVYGKTTVQHVDTIEKKPLYHFYPGTKCYSIATEGCNMHCQYCTNWQVSQINDIEHPFRGIQATPEEIVRSALDNNCRSMSYTYVEPTIFLEYINDIATLARVNGLKNVYKSNGFMTLEAIEVCAEWLDAANIDLKSFREVTYRKMGARLDAVLDCMRMLKSKGIWLEVSSLIIPNVNDSPEELTDMARFVAQELGPETPWHILRFFPAYEMQDTSPTSLDLMHRAREIGEAQGLKHIYYGNIVLPDYQSTHCSSCNALLIHRKSFSYIKKHMKGAQCYQCGTELPGIGFGGIA